MDENVKNPLPDEREGPSKKKKKPKLSKQEKRRLKALAALELKKRLIREQLLRELELSKKSQKRGKIEWDGLCREIKLKEFREEVKELGEKVERVLEKKNEKIEMLLKNIGETQELHERNFTEHLQQLEYLTKCHQTFRNTATALYDLQTSGIINDFLRDISGTLDTQKRTKLNYENILHMSNVVVKDQLRKNYEVYMHQKFDDVSAEIEKRYLLQDRTASKMRVLQDTLLLWIKDLQGDLVDVLKTIKFLYYMDRQRTYTKESTKLNECERVSRKTILHLKKELQFIESDCNRKIYGLKLEYAYFAEVRSIIKRSIERDKQMTHIKLLRVSNESYKVLNKLKEFVKNGELLLSLAVCCRKYQTEKEKVLPWTTETDISYIDPDLRFEMTFDIAKHLNISEEELADQIGFMKNFWFRFSEVRLRNLLLMEEKRKLNEENEKYRNIIRSMKKSDDVKYILESLQIKQLQTV